MKPVSQFGTSQKNMVKVGFYAGNVRMLLDVFKVSSLALMFFFAAGLEIFYFGLTFIRAFLSLGEGDNCCCCSKEV